LPPTFTSKNLQTKDRPKTAAPLKFKKDLQKKVEMKSPDKEQSPSQLHTQESEEASAQNFSPESESNRMPESSMQRSVM